MDNAVWLILIVLLALLALRIRRSRLRGKPKGGYRRGLHGDESAGSDSEGE